MESFKRDVYKSFREFEPVVVLLSVTGRKWINRGKKVTGTKHCIAEVSELDHTSYTDELSSPEFQHNHK